LRGLDIDREG